jgi:hypothetical protein
VYGGAGKVGPKIRRCLKGRLCESAELISPMLRTLPPTRRQAKAVLLQHEVPGRTLMDKPAIHLSAQVEIAQSRSWRSGRCAPL